MRSLIVVTTAAALVMAGIPTMPSYGQSAATPARAGAVTPNPAVVALFKAFPQGGEELSKRIADLVVSNRKLAPELANYVVKTPGLSKAQKIAAERGLAAALERLGINAADLGVPVYKAPPPPGPVEEAFCPLCFLAVAAVIGGGIACALECFKEEKHVFLATDN